MNFPPVSALPERRKIVIFGIFSSCAQIKQNFGKLFVVFERQLSGIPANAIRDYARSLFTHFFMPKLKSFGVAPTSSMHIRSVWPIQSSRITSAVHTSYDILQ